MIGAVTPVRSTVLLCLFRRTWRGPELMVAAFPAAAGVLLSVRESRSPGVRVPDRRGCLDRRRGRRGRG